ncbi:MAG: zinc ribbon domain-containing protein [Lachnospiraceae bacterium]|nr:zinc ribbon domain-containing protein [Lachnospiraceae bacterium]
MKESKHSLLSTWMSIGIAIFGIVWTIAAIQMDDPLFASLGVFFIVASVASVAMNIRNIIRVEGEIRMEEAKLEEEVSEATEVLHRMYPVFVASEATEGETSETSEVADLPKAVEEPTNYCPYCGAKTEEGYLYCRVCGKKLPE